MILFILETQETIIQYNFQFAFLSRLGLHLWRRLILGSQSHAFIYLHSTAYGYPSTVPSGAMNF